MTPTRPPAADVDELRTALLEHYDRTARDLPWRRDRDPYRVLVSEIMLQQTRVETVVGYYEPWLERFPTVEALAAADEDEVMKAWEGLGYYRRARNLHRAARMVREGADRETAPSFPSTYEGLRELPGVGEYTAGAVASIAFRKSVPAVDGNVRRVLSRLYDESDPRPGWLRERAERLVDSDRPGDWNQALMELGATVCTPRSPDCDVCPLTRWCAARAAGTQEARPAPSGNREVPTARFVLAVLERDGRVLVERRATDGLLGGLWAFPEARMDVGEPSGAADGASDGADTNAAATASDTVDRAAARDIADRLGIPVVGVVHALEPVKHRFSHLRATYAPVVLRVASLQGADPPRPVRWIDPEGDDSTALPVAQRKVLEAWRAARDAEEEAV